MPCDGWQKTIPSIKGEYMALILWWLNIVNPGAGTIFSSCLGEADWLIDQIIVGILQNWTASCFIGWCWSAWWGGMIYKRHQ